MPLCISVCTVARKNEINSFGFVFTFNNVHNSQQNNTTELQTRLKYEF